VPVGVPTRAARQIDGLLGMGTGPLQMHVLLQRAAARTMIWRNSSRGPPRCSPPTLLSRRSLPVVAAQLFGADGNNLLILLCF